jgi:2-methylcitrate dehydratase PrpD
MISARFAHFASRLRANDIPTEILSHAKLCILDSIGIALAARSYDFAQRALAAVSLLGGSGPAPVIGQAHGLPLRDAVLANGTLIHSLDFDDTHSGSVVHCTASTWPIAFNVGFSVRACGADVLAAFVLALELDARIGEVAGGGLQKRGYHPTGIVGAFGCAAATAYLRRLTEGQHQHALGIVLSMASGSMEFVSDGAWTKRLHPGWAGVAGITAAAFAETGFIGPSAPFEGRFGLYNTLRGADHDIDLATIGADLGRTWRTCEIAFKPYPACHFNHAFADCALALKNAHGLALDDIASMTALIHPDQAAIVCEPLAAKRCPQSAYEAQFSVPYMIASSLVHGRFGLAELEPEAINDRATRALAAVVDYADDPSSAYPQYYSAGLIIVTHSGARLEHHIRVNRGADANPMSAFDIRDKYQDNAERAVSPAQAALIAALVLNLDTAPELGELVRALTTDLAKDEVELAS